MSFLHTLHVGFFGLPGDSHAPRDLLLGECRGLIEEFVRLDSHRNCLDVAENPRDDRARAVALAYADGHPIMLQRGALICPYLGTRYILPSIEFMRFVRARLGCSIYSHDEGRVLAPDELPPKQPFSEVMAEVLRQHSMPEPDR